MIGREYPSEIVKYQDPKTGKEITQLTTGHQNVHMYFTDNSFTAGDREIYFTSTRPYEDQERSNLFKMDLETGIMTQLTDEVNGIGSCTKTPDSEIAVYVLDRRQVVKLNTRTGQKDVIYEETGGYQIGHPFISHDKKYVGFERNEKQEHGVGKNYTGFAETMFGIKKSYTISNSHRMTATSRCSATRAHGIWFSRESGFWILLRAMRFRVTASSRTTASAMNSGPGTG